MTRLRFSLEARHSASEALGFEEEREAHQHRQIILTWLDRKGLIKAEHPHVLRQARLRVALAEAFKVASRI